MSWFGLRKSSTSEPAAPKEQEPEAVRALPSSWYRSDAMYQLERRSIFSKKWLVATHVARVPNVGDYVRITEAGYTFFIIRDRKGEIKAHHNICRHRAFPMVHEDSGNLKVLACQYHGWSYGFNGKLAKAPKYQELPSFDKSANGLYRVHTHVDRIGFIWVNLDASETPEISWDEQVGDVDIQPRLAKFDLTKYRYDHEWSMIGDYNWKTLADNYNECYHCPIGHPCVNKFADTSQYWVETTGYHIRHFNVDKADVDPNDAPQHCSTFFYPNASITVTPVFMFIQRCIPMSATKTSMEYEVYRHVDAPEDKFKQTDDLFKEIMGEDKVLCNGAQKNLNAGVFTSGELHPRVEKGPLFFQKVTRRLVMDHRQEEERAGKDIWPATPKPALSEESNEEIDFCRKLDCAAGNEELAW